MIRAKRSLDLITIGSAIYCNAFLSVGQNKSGRFVTYLFRWHFPVKILILVILQDIESVILKYSIDTAVVTESKH